jgi:hypothetical protein
MIINRKFLYPSPSQSVTLSKKPTPTDTRGLTVYCSNDTIMTAYSSAPSHNVAFIVNGQCSPSPKQCRGASNENFYKSEKVKDSTAYYLTFLKIGLIFVLYLKRLAKKSLAKVICRVLYFDQFSFF